MSQVGDVEDFEAVAVDHKSVAKLNRDGSGIVERGLADGSSDFWREGIFEVDNDEVFPGENVGVISGYGDAASAVEKSLRIEGERALKEVVGRIAVEESANAWALRFQVWVADDDEAFFAVGDVKKTVKQRNRLLLIFGKLDAKRIDSESGGRGHGHGVFCGDEES